MLVATCDMKMEQESYQIGQYCSLVLPDTLSVADPEAQKCRLATHMVWCLDADAIVKKHKEKRATSAFDKTLNDGLMHMSMYGR